MTPAAPVAVAVSPAESEMLRGQVVERVRDAMARRCALRLAGRGQWLDAGRPVHAWARLELGQLRGIVEYTPGDLTLTALAGTSLEEIAAATRPEGQWLALDPPGGDAGSIGAVVATASAGPLAHSAGTPRDNVLGLEVVTGGAETVRAGGRVVKNVAGFDIVRLMTGAWGTLGAITEVTVRLRALPAVDETMALPLPADGRGAAALLRALRTAPLQPLALELASAALARRLGLGGAAVVLVRLGGNEELVRAQRRTVTGLGDAIAIPTDVWTGMRAPDPDGWASVRMSSPVARLAELWAHVTSIAEGAGGWTQASAGRGVVRAVLPATDGPGDALAGIAARAHGLVGERMPAQCWPEIAPCAVNDALSTRIRSAFDPYRLLNPGVLGEDPA